MALGFGDGDGLEERGAAGEGFDFAAAEEGLVVGAPGDACEGSDVARCFDLKWGGVAQEGAVGGENAESVVRRTAAKSKERANIYSIETRRSNKDKERETNM